jgi:hypothetical protein
MEQVLMSSILIWLSIFAAVVTLVLVISSLRKVVTRSDGASRWVVVTVLFSLITSVLTIVSLIAALQQLGLL